ncbi:ribose transport system substrate-binding protein/ribose transport system permease protein [Micromonospora pattaloongensis]|uniref:Ribose transport system substrate-binding protein/ribose transport system permease protein n=1 Tax=Micromonospora pattaloongensis TaxID=405436 RepID=A0A1H3SYI3_9ACTN|nr:substrate-binding domain-containing protein [Micromonospora pattaloongensis]SDZ42631.1 ribose transport system substrate-binding protein/ribose transport system permease protein [Micromonospora pattaloongensis]
MRVFDAKMTRRASLSLGAAAVLAAVGACSSGSKSGSGSGDKIGWSVAYFDHPVYQLMMKGAKEEAAKLGVEVIFADGKNDPAVQTQQLNNFLAQKLDGIILTPAVSDPMIPAIKKVNQAKVPFAVVDRRMETKGSGIKWDFLVSWDMVKSGTVGGEQIVKALNGKGKIAVVEGTAGAGSTVDRGGAFYKVIAANPGIEVVYKADGNFTRSGGQQVTEAILQRFPKGQLDAIYYMADEMLFGGIQAIKNAGRRDDLKIVSCDGDKNALDMLRKGEIDYDGIFFPQDEGVIGTRLMTQLLKGEKPDFANQEHEGRKAALEEHEGMVWVKPDFFGVDPSNMNDPQFVGW